MTPPTGSRAARNIVVALSLIGWAVLAIQTWNPRQQWDFKAYYTASRLYSAGGNPYDLQAMRKQAGSDLLVPYYYPPAVLYVARPVSEMDYVAAHRLWLLLKLAALAATLLIWKRWFLRDTNWAWILPVTLLGFGAAAVWDVQSGNVSGFEEVFLWAGLAFLLRKRTTAFTVCIVLAAACKMTPAAFLLLLLLPGFRSRGNIIRMIAGFAVVGAVIGVPFIGKPELVRPFLHGLWSAHSGLQYNPTFFGALGELAVKHHIAVLGGPLKYVLLAGYLAGLLWASRHFLARVVRSESIRLAILVAVMLYALVMPRFVIYSYLIVLVPFLSLIIPLVIRTQRAAVAAAIAVCITGLRLIPGGTGDFLGNWIPFLLLVACWALLIVSDRSRQLPELKV